MRGARRISFRGICRRHRFARRACCTAFSQSSTTPSCHWHASRSLRPTVTSRSSPASLRSPGPLHRTFPSPAPPRLATGTHIGHFARPTSLHCSRHRFARLPLSHRLFPAQHHPVLPLGRISVTSPVDSSFFRSPSESAARSRAGELSAPENRYPRSPRAPLPAAPSASPRRARTVR